MVLPLGRSAEWKGLNDLKIGGPGLFFLDQNEQSKINSSVEFTLRYGRHKFTFSAVRYLIRSAWVLLYGKNA